jgi:hypothetical protein
LSEFHYVRTMGVEGGVDAVEGPAVGLDLDAILKAGLPPFKIALEIIAALCEILDIADQDQEIHGDISPRYVFLDETGAVSVESFGARRSKTTAPEGSPKGTVTDLYGLGVVAFRLLAPRDLPKLPDSADGHDDAVIDAIVGVNFEDLPEQIVGDIQWYLAKLLSYEREDRPTPVDCWRTFIAFADAVQGPRLDEWANAAIAGGGDRRDQNAAAAAPQPPAGGAGEEEDLGGPVTARGPLSAGVSFGGGGKKGQATAFWSKDAMKAALEAEDKEEYKPKAGGGHATSFWTKEQMQAMEKGGEEAPRPKRKPDGKAPTAFFSTKDIKKDAEKPEKPPMPVKAPVATAPPPIKQSAPPPVPKNDAEPAEEGGGGSMKFVVIGVVVLLLVALCGGVLVFGGGAAMFMSNGSGTTASDDGDETKAETEEEPKEEPVEEPKEEPKEEPAKEDAKPAEVKPEPKPEPKPQPKPEPKPQPKPTVKPEPAPKPETTSKPTGRTPTPKKSAGPFTVKMSMAGVRGKLNCAGENQTFDGSARIEIDPASTPLPVNCMVVTEDKKRGVFIVSDSSKTSITCEAKASEVSCH